MSDPLKPLGLAIALALLAACNQGAPAAENPDLAASGGGPVRIAIELLLFAAAVAGAALAWPAWAAAAVAIVVLVAVAANLSRWRWLVAPTREVPQA